MEEAEQGKCGEETEVYTDRNNGVCSETDYEKGMRLLSSSYRRMARIAIVLLYHF